MDCGLNRPRGSSILDLTQTRDRHRQTRVGSDLARTPAVLCVLALGTNSGASARSVDTLAFFALPLCASSSSCPPGCFVG
eukprot:5994313-Pleurochrysis_carterae.AAC.1